MKHWGKITGAIFAMLLAFTSLQAQAASKADREFNHMSTGFPLTGVHATTACETCHVGGVFVGTPRACDGCHATGKRIVATPKSVKHIVTDAPCETCHFNTSTFFGARFNHGTAVPGQCEQCHNGRITEGKPSAHPVTMSACDNCHRSSSWLPASWNHRDTVSDCSTCHPSVAGPNNPGRSVSVAHLPMSMPPATFTGNCKACHTNYYSFLSAFYNHSGAGTACQNCHGSGGATVAGPVATYTGVRAAGTTGVQTVHAAIGAGNFAAATCLSCHKNYGTFLGATYDHVGASAAGCQTCHDTASPTFGGYLQVKSAARHTVYASAGTASGVASISLCSSCHTNTSTWAASRYDHAGVTNCTICHQGNAGWNTYIKQMSAKHIPFDAAVTNCTVCHTSASSWATVARGATLHNYVTTIPGCYTCHGSNTLYSGNGQQTARWPSFHESSKNPAATDCSASGCHRPGGTKGTLYQRWK